MSVPFRFHCSRCEQWHEGIPSPGWPYPIEYLNIPTAEQEGRTELTSDTCVIDGQWFFVRVCLEVPIREHSEPLVYGVWVSVSEPSFALFQRTYEEPEREQYDPLFGWLTAVPPPFPEALLKSLVYLRPVPMRPLLELEPTEHPLAVAQREGITLTEAQRIAEQLAHS